MKTIMTSQTTPVKNEFSVIENAGFECIVYSECKCVQYNNILLLM